jgi:hypothetical protein
MKTLCLVLALGSSTVVFAQPPVPGRLEASVGGRWSGRELVGSRDATLTQPDDGRFPFFSTTSEEGQAVAVEGRLGARLTGALQLEVAVSYGRFDLRSRITADAEEIPDVTVSETITQLTVDVGFVEYLRGLAVGRRVVPFVSLGGGLARQLHEGRTLVETAGFGYVGGGMALLMFTRPEAGLKAVGLRVEARGRFRQGGVALDDDVHLSPEAGASIILRF